MIYAILIIYIAVTFWGSLFGLKGKNQTPESYFLADRGLGTLSLFFTILATNFSAFYFLGFAGEGYKIGLIHYVMMSLGTALASISFFVIGTKVWQLGKDNGYITPAELIYDKSGSRSLSVTFTIVMIVFTLPYLALQIVGGGYILSNLTGGDLNYAFSIILLTVFTIIYVILGGMTSVAKTDLKQGLIVIFFMILAVIFVAADYGGLSSANLLAQETLPELFSIQGVNQHYDIKKWVSFMVFWFFCIPMFPQIFMRFYIAKDLIHLKRSAIMYAFIPLIISLFPVLIGLWGHISLDSLPVSEADQILPKMLLIHSSEIFSALIMTGAIAAFMSTLDSQLLALSTMITRDIYIPLSKSKLDFKKEVLIGRVVVGILAVLGLSIAFNPFDTIFDMGKMAFSGLAVLFPTALAAVRFKISTPIFFIIGISLSIFSILGFYYGWIPQSMTLGFEFFIISILISFLVCLIGFGKD